LRSILPLAAALSVVVTPALAADKVCAACVAANMARLAGPEARGRACGTQDENVAARFIAERFAAYGVKGAADRGAYLQPVPFRTPTYAATPTLSVGDLTVRQGEGMVVLSAPQALPGALHVVASAGDSGAVAGKIVVLQTPYEPRAAASLLRAGALAIVAPATEQVRGAWRELAQRPPPGVEIEGVEASPSASRPVVFATPETLAALKARHGQTATFSAPLGAPREQTSYNVLGVIRGAAKDADRQAILLSAHYDHVGVKDGVIYPGANDDASGVAAVLEFARLFGAGKPPQRTIYFALFGCEEQGGHGAKLFLAKPPLPLSDIAANLEFEMIGLPDPKHPKTLMLTGWERSNLGPTLKAQGADIGPDPYPEQNFFQRSDNYQLALKGVVAQTVSAWPVPPTYHQPSDTLENVDLKFMAEVIQSLAGPIAWLANSDFRPQWSPGGAPSP
jgi:hypothetical protein